MQDEALKSSGRVTCSRCGAERIPANLTIVNGEPWCPECRAKRDEYDIAHQRAADPKGVSHALP